MNSLAPSLDLPAKCAPVVRDLPLSGRRRDEHPLPRRELVPVRRLDDQGEAVRKRRVEGLGAGVVLDAALVRRAGVHGRPPVAQLGQQDALDPPLADERKEPVLVLGLRPADLVDQHGLRAPHGRRGLEEPDAGAVLVREGEADQVVEGDEAGVVMAVHEPQRLRQRVEKKGFAGARGADEQERVLGDEGPQDQGFEGIEPVHPESGQPREFGRCHDFLLLASVSAGRRNGRARAKRRATKKPASPASGERVHSPGHFVAALSRRPHPRTRREAPWVSVPGCRALS